MAAKKSNPTGQRPVLIFNPDDAFNGTAFAAAMVWPHDPSRRRDVAASWGSAIMGLAPDAVPAMAPELLDVAFEEAARQQGLSSADLFPPALRQTILDMLTEHGGKLVADWAESSLFKPSGGYVRVAHAPGLTTLEAEMERAARGGASAAGYMLAVVAILDTFHPELTASLNRAGAVVEAARKKVPGISWPQDSNAKRSFKEWRSVAPLWAAFMLVQHQICREAQLAEQTLTPDALVVRFNMPSTRAHDCVGAMVPPVRGQPSAGQRSGAIVAGAGSSSDLAGRA
jgi:hypothetical protein